MNLVSECLSMKLHESSQAYYSMETLRFGISCKKLVLPFILCLLFWLVIVQAAENNISKSARSRYSLIKLFDFNQFKEIFNKYYGSTIENVARQRLFLGRAVRAFVSAVNYKYYKLSYYLSINHMSDWTQEELSRISMRQSDKVDDVRKSVEPLPIADPHQVEQELNDVIAKAEEPGFKEISEELITPSTPPTPPLEDADNNKLSLDDSERDVSVNDLVGKAELVGSQITADKLPSMNPTMSLKEAEKINSVSKAGGFLSGLVKKTAKSIGVAKSHKIKGNEKPDEVFVDHRESGCLGKPKLQGICGSCYIFAAITLYEYHYCMRTTEQISFSEQYIVDCGHFTGLKGCDGGKFTDIPKFVSQYGLELTEHYKYRDNQDSCPYNKDISPSSMGYMNLFDEGFRCMDQSNIEKYLENEPMIMNLRHTSELFEYGGGVHEARGCRFDDRIHSMVLIGHGREDDQEYWLLRNSQDTVWGEQGYYKLSKKSDCFDPRYGYILWNLQVPENSINEQYVGADLLKRRMFRHI